MSKLFYDHLIIIEEIVAVLNAHELSPEDRKKLLAIIDETMHSSILDTILTHLPREHHKEFLGRLTSYPRDSALMQFLKEKTEVDIEKEILKTVGKVKKQILTEIKKSKQK